MARPAHPRRRRRRSLRALAAFGLATAGLVLAALFVGVTAQGNALSREIEAMRSDILGQQARQARLEARITEQRDDAYVIDQARGYGYVRENESLMGVPREGQASASSGRPARGSATQLQKWIAFFFGRR